MSQDFKIWFALVAGTAWLLPVPPLSAATLDVPTTFGALSNILNTANPGDVLRLRPGVHKGPIIIAKSVTLTGENKAIIDGGGASHVVTITAPNVVLRKLTIQGSGKLLETEDSGIYVTKDGDGARIEDNVIRNNLIGVNLKGPKKAVVRGNRIKGFTNMRVNERGNGVQLWNTPGSVIEGNEITDGRDGIFTTTSRDNIFHGNTFRKTRIAVHYMYTNNSTVSDNISVGNHVGYALMFSTGLNVHGNLSEGDRDHGILMNYANRSKISSNVVRNGKNKCVFIYNSSKNIFRRNRFEACAIGIHFTAGSEHNDFTENAFIRNRHQVKYVGTRWLDWSVAGRGNFWSDNPAFDLDGDGLADVAYRPNDMVDEVLWAYPVAKLLLNSPAVKTLRWAQSQFPALHPGGVVDNAPLMKPASETLTVRRPSNDRPNG
jgi:nitrous oxidase accessory protein